jgi:5-methylcytosine-specific restriction enzyme subunit McrC
MEKLFEQFIAGVLSEEPAYYFGSNVQVDTQYRIGPIVYTQLNKPLFHLIPDIVVTDGLHKIIIDTKYKRLKQEERKKGVISNDVYQMHAYVSKKDADSCMLLYPEIDYKDAVNFEFRMKEGTIEEKKVPFYIGSIKLTHKLTDPKGWNNFRKELSLLMRQMMIRTNLPDNSAKPIPSK